MKKVQVANVEIKISHKLNTTTVMYISLKRIFYREITEAIHQI